VDDLSQANPIDDMCLEPVKWHPRKCLCHSEPWAMAYLDERDRQREKVLMEIRLREIAAGAPTWADKLNGS
jgi:hypothetical protein